MQETGQVPDGEVSIPSVPESVAATGLSAAYLEELVLKTLYIRGKLPARDVCDAMSLPFGNVVEPVLDALAEERLCQVTGGAGYVSASWTWQLTGLGRDRARELLGNDGYVGPAPVTLEAYVAMVKEQTLATDDVTPHTVAEAFNDLVMPKIFARQIGPAVRSGKSIFLYGPPGNGKTSVAERIVRMLGGAVWLPHAVQVGGQVITVLDTNTHVVRDDLMRGLAGHVELDRRWSCCDRPLVMVGGELTFEALDLTFDANTRLYTAPIQMKANNGVLLVDDFGRQRVSPKELLNRWIVPLEKRQDYLNLVTGRQIQIPFEVLVVFSTNLDPKDLADEAFLRRIRYKLPVEDPHPSVFKRIFSRGCRQRSIAFDDATFDWMLETFWTRKNRPLRCCQPRDILDQIVDRAAYEGVAPEFTAETLESACDTYFVEL